MYHGYYILLLSIVPYKFNFQATVDHHGYFMYRGHDITSVNFPENILL